MNALFKTMVHPQDSVLQFITQYEYIAATRLEKEHQEGAKGETTNAPLWGRSLIEKQASKFYTRTIFFKFQELLRDSTALTTGAFAKEGSQMKVQVRCIVLCCFFLFLFFAHVMLIIIHSPAHIMVIIETLVCMCVCFLGVHTAALYFLKRFQQSLYSLG